MFFQFALPSESSFEGVKGTIKRAKSKGKNVFFSVSCIQFDLFGLTVRTVRTVSPRLSDCESEPFGLCVQTPRTILMLLVFRRRATLVTIENVTDSSYNLSDEHKRVA